MVWRQVFSAWAALFVVTSYQAKASNEFLNNDYPEYQVALDDLVNACTNDISKYKQSIYAYLRYGNKDYSIKSGVSGHLNASMNVTNGDSGIASINRTIAYFQNSAARDHDPVSVSYNYVGICIHQRRIVQIQRGLFVDKSAPRTKIGPQYRPGLKLDDGASVGASAAPSVPKSSSVSRAPASTSSSGLVSPDTGVSYNSSIANPTPLSKEEKALITEKASEELDDILGTMGKVGEAALMKWEGEDAKHCLRLVYGESYNDSARIYNECPATVEAVWCVEGFSCHPTFSYMATVSSGGHVYVNGSSGENSGSKIWYAACKGKNTIKVTRDKLFKYTCEKEFR